MVEMHPAERVIPMVGELMAISARTSPRARGMEALVIRLVEGEDLLRLAADMRALGEGRNLSFFLRDAGNVEASGACLLIGLKKEPTAGLDCGACGFPTCQQMLSHVPERYAKNLLFGPSCAIRLTDLGIAIGSAVKTASLHNVDNRVMYSVGAAAVQEGWLEGCTIGFGIPLSGTHKNIYFDR